MSIDTLIDLESFLESAWGAEIGVVARDAELMSAGESFAAAVEHVAKAVGDCGLRGAPGVRFYLGGESLSLSRRIVPFLPRVEDQGWESYAERIERVGEGRDWCLIINDPPHYTSLFETASTRFFYPLVQAVGVPLNQYSAELFAGRYASTPFEIHTDPNLESFYSVLVGGKRLWFWEPDHWTRKGFDFPPRFLELSDRDRELADVRDVERGDLLYWPADYWHVGETPNFTVSLGVSLVRPRPEQAGARLRQLVLNALKRMVEPRPCDPFLPISRDQPWRSVPAELIAEASRVRAAANGLEDELQSFWLALCTNRGSFDAMATSSDISPAMDELADPSWQIRLASEVLLAWRRSSDGTLVVASRGARWACVDSSELVVLLASTLR